MDDPGSPAGPACVCMITTAGLWFALAASTDAPKFNAIATPLPLSYLASLFYQHNMILGASSLALAGNSAERAFLERRLAEISA